jgi:hypothetical protein
VVEAASFRWMEACQQEGNWVWTELFLHDEAWFWSWSVLAAALSAAVLVLVALVLLRLEYSFKYVLRRVGYTCTHCQHRGVPLFRSACGQLHDDLRPGFYGVWKALCGHCRAERLPVSDLAGRLRLTKVCANADCGRDLSDTSHGSHAEFHFVIVGAPSSSKSMLMLTAMWQLIEEFAVPQRIQCTFTDQAQERFYNDGVALLRRGQRLAKTDTSDHPRAFTLTLKPRWGPARRIYLYDAAGEHFTAGDIGLAGHGITRHIDGILFLIDPFAEDGVRRTLDASSLASLPDRAAAARNDAQDILVQVLPFWERMFGVSGAGVLPVPVAVVVTKVDLCDLESRLGSPPVLRGSVNVKKAADVAESRSERVRSFLEKHGLRNFVDVLEQRFGQRVRYFAASAQGRSYRVDDTTPFRPRGVLGPVIWLGWQTAAFKHGGLGRQMLGNLVEFLRRAWSGREGSTLQIVLRLLVAAVLGSALGTLWWLGGWLLIAGGLLGLVLGAAAWNRYQTRGVRDPVPKPKAKAKIDPKRAPDAEDEPASRPSVGGGTELPDVASTHPGPGSRPGRTTLLEWLRRQTGQDLDGVQLEAFIELWDKEGRPPAPEIVRLLATHLTLLFVVLEKLPATSQSMLFAAVARIAPAPGLTDEVLRHLESVDPSLLDKALHLLLDKSNSAEVEQRVQPHARRLLQRLPKGRVPVILARRALDEVLAGRKKSSDLAYLDEFRRSAAFQSLRDVERIRLDQLFGSAPS